MIPRMVEVSKFNGKTWEPSGTAVFHGFFSDYEEFAEGPGNYPAALIEWEDGRIESVVAHSIRFLVPTLTLEAAKDSVRADWLSKEMQTPAKGFPVIHALKIGDTVELPSDLPECGGLRLRGILISFPKFGDSEVLLQIGNGPKQYINVPTYSLVRVPEPMGQGRMIG